VTQQIGLHARLNISASNCSKTSSTKPRAEADQRDPQLRRADRRIEVIQQMFCDARSPVAFDDERFELGEPHFDQSLWRRQTVQEGQSQNGEGFQCSIPGSGFMLQSHLAENDPQDVLQTNDPHFFAVPSARGSRCPDPAFTQRDLGHFFIEVEGRFQNASEPVIPKSSQQRTQVQQSGDSTMAAFLLHTGTAESPRARSRDFADGRFGGDGGSGASGMVTRCTLRFWIEDAADHRAFLARIPGRFLHDVLNSSRDPKVAR
jgi:hypothetical protein